MLRILEKGLIKQILYVYKGVNKFKKTNKNLH